MTPAKEFRQRLKNGCSIRFSRLKILEQDSGCRLRRGLSKKIRARSSIKPKPTAAQPSGSFFPCINRERICKILLVEDDSAIGATSRRVLAEEGYEVTVEKTDDGGLSRAKANLFDVVVTDLK